MRKLVTLALMIGAFIGVGAVGVPPALAANSTCSQHANDFGGYNPPQQVSEYFDFQCGGANNEDYNITGKLAYKQGTSWQTASCNKTTANDPAVTCIDYRPTGMPYFNGGEEHAGFFNYWLTNSVNSYCAGSSHLKSDWRLHVIVDFAGGSPSLDYYSYWTAASGFSC